MWLESGGVYMRNIKNLSKEKKDILNDAVSILYTCKRYLGNLYEKEVIKYNGKYYRVQAVNKQITEFVEV